MSKNRLTAHSLKWNPFSQQVPVEALRVTPAIDSFGWRIENLARDGGFALVAGDPGTGKSSVLRLLEARLARMRDVQVGVVTRPQSGLADFYRELGDLFGVELSPHNRWAGTKVLRESWLAHVDTSLHRPVLLIDEAQEVPSAVLNELRLLASVALDSRLLLAVVLAGDNRLTTRFRRDELLPLGSRIRVRLNLEPSRPEQLAESLRHALDSAGNARLMSEELIAALAEHAAGNHRTLMTMADDLLAIAMQRDLAHIDEKLFFEVFTPSAAAAEPEIASSRRRSRRRAS